jgi:hypothetical protein
VNGPRHDRLPDIAALGLYLSLTFLLTWPMPSQMSTHLAGRSNDVYINPWANWWTEKAVCEGQRLYFTSYIFYPYGVSLTAHSFSHLNTLFWFALRPLLGTLAAYNATVLLAYPLSAYAMFALVRYLTRSARAGFVAGLIFAFSPYHMVESAHPVLVTTQWLPLFILFLIKTIRTRYGRPRHAAPALLFLWLTGLSSWHLLAFALILASTVLVYSLIAERHLWDRKLALLLAGAGLVCALMLAPLACPIIREQLSTDTPHFAVPVHLAEGNDLLSFLLPGPYHPIFGRLTAPIHELSGLSGRRPAYLGFAAIGLALVAIRTRRRSSLCWGLAGLLFGLLSVGPYVEIAGYRLNESPLPWAVPVAGFFRNPFRLNTLISFCLAVLAGMGSARLLQSLGRRGRWERTLVAAGLATVILLEYLSVPLPRTALHVSAFYDHLAGEGGDGAVVEVPMGRARDKEYMVYQTIHGRPMVNGVVSRLPQDAYRFLAETPILSALQANQPPAWPERHLWTQLAPLAERDIETIIFHRERLDPGSLEEWRDYFAFPPAFEDEQIVVYRIQPQAVPIARLTPDLTLAWVGLPSEPRRQGDAFSVEAVWTTAAGPSRDWGLRVRIETAEGITAQRTSFPLRPDHPTSTWPEAAAVRGEYTVQVDPHLPPGRYRLTLALFPISEDVGVEKSTTVGTIEVRPLERTFTAPPLEHRADAVFGDALALLGYGLRQEPDALHLTLHWQALDRLGYYKVFVHLYDARTGALVAQHDAVPRGWTYPTNWWEAGEVVSDEVSLPLAGVPAGVHRIGVGVYDPDTLERLPVQTGDGAPLGDRLDLEEGIRVP